MSYERRMTLNLSLRGERARFIGCHVGSPSLSGCGNGCCRSWGPGGIEENERVNYLTGWTPAECRWPKPSHSRHPHRCAIPGRPKYVCFSCHRTFKPAIIGGNEYENLSLLREGWLVRPGRESERMREVWRAQKKLQNQKTDEGRKRLKETRIAIAEFLYGVHQDEAVPEWLKAVAPELWWRRLGSRCPGCGGNGQPVGPSFRAPKQHNSAAWRHAQTRVEAGDEFRFCATKEVDAQLREEADRIRRREAQSSAWDQEKLRRQRELGLRI